MRRHVAVFQAAAVLACAFAPAGRPPAAMQRIARPNVVLVIFDTTRADRFFGPHGATRLNRLPGTAFTDTWAQAPSTSSAVATLFTGLLPTQHGVFDGGGALARSVPTLAEQFRAAGYTTVHVTGNPNSGPLYGLDRGFQQVVWSGRGSASALLHHQLQYADAVGGFALEFLARAKSPFLLSLHFNDPHSPYDPISPPPLRAPRRILDEPASDPGVGRVLPLERDDMIARYDAEVASVDRTLARIVDALRRGGLWERTVLLVTADHGEEFQEHGGWGHSHTLYPEVLRIPLFIRQPGDRVRHTVRGRVNQADILPTILDLTGFPRVGGISGRSRAGLLSGTPGGTVSTLAEKLSPDKGEPRRLLLTDSWAFIERASSGRAELYDMKRDPAQLRDLAASRPEEVQRMRAELRRTVGEMRRASPAESAPIDPDTLRNLQALGYLQGRRSTAGGTDASGDAELTVGRVLANTVADDLWTPFRAPVRLVADDSPNAFEVRLSFPGSARRAGAGRLRFAASTQATRLSNVTVGAAEGAETDRRPVSFEGALSRRIPPGAIVESDPVLLPQSDRWVVTFTATPLGLVRMTGVDATTELRPASDGLSRGPHAWTRRPNSLLGLAGIRPHASATRPRYRR